MKAPLLSIQGIDLFRQEIKVLKNFTLDINQGENWILLGPNGSGKSTVLSLLQGFLWPQEGNVSVLGRIYGEDDITEIRKVIGWVGNELETKFMPGDTGLDIIRSGAVGTLGLKFDEPTEDQENQVKSLVREMNLGELVKKHFYKLSQGERRLISIARALINQPELLILDEACAGLDPVAREDFLNRLGALEALKKSPVVLFATHHVEEIRPPFSHCLMLKNGIVFKAGKIKEVLNSKNLSGLFDRDLKLSKSGISYKMEIIS